ncbi:MAG: hypothetical protein MUE52_18970 [Tabrizicola sp.]|jgi:ribose transport system permease protein|nr:hypothetical protein [Tabrizicola sp.]
MELTVIAPAVMGSSRSVTSATLGATLIESIFNILILIGVSTFWLGAFVGLFITLAIAFDRVIAQLGSKN